MPRRPILALVCGGALAMALSGCTPALWGGVGLTLDPDGNVVAAVQVCEGAIDRVSAYYYRDPQLRKVEDLAVWVFEDDVSDFDTISLGSQEELERLAASHEVYLDADVRDRSHQTSRIELTPELCERSRKARIRTATRT